MSEIVDLTYYQRTRNVILNKAKNKNKNDKERFKEQAKDKYRSLCEEEKTKRENTGKIGIIIYPKKKRKSKKLLQDKKSLNITIYKIVFNELTN